MQRIAIKAQALDAIEDQLRADYARGVITLVYKRVTKLSQRDLVFAIVELLPLWFEEPTELDVFVNVDKTAGIEVNARRVVFSAEDALKWYLDCRSCATPQLPATKNDKANGWDKENSRPLTVFPLGEEPIWPALVVPRDGDVFWDSASIWGRYPGGFRWHQLRALAPPSWYAIWGGVRNAEEARSFLAKHLPVDITERPFALGSVHLVLPNPILRSVNLRESRVDGSRIMLELKPAPYMKTIDLEMHIREHRAHGPTWTCVERIRDAAVSIDFPSEVDKVSLDLFCPIRGLIYSSRPSNFIRGILIGIGVISKQRIVQIPMKTGKGKAGEHVQPVVGHVHMTQAGTVQQGTSARSIIYSERNRIKNAQTAKDLMQTWFNGDKKEATHFVREVIGESQEDLLIVDPYFGVQELMSFALAVRNSKLTIRILTSADYLRKPVEENSLVENGDVLQRAVESVRKSESDLATLKVGVMMGVRPDIHDRFIKTPSSVWVLGSSLNEFGSRGTLTMRLPFPDPVAEQLERAWFDAMSIEDFTVSRKVAKKKTGVKRNTAKKNNAKKKAAQKRQIKE